MLVEETANAETNVETQSTNPAKNWPIFSAKEHDEKVGLHLTFLLIFLVQSL